MKTLVGGADDSNTDEMIRNYRKNYQHNFGKLTGIMNLRDYANNAMVGTHVRFLNALNNMS